MRFNRTPPSITGRIDQPPTDLIKNTLSLWNVSVEDAMKYGGDLTRAAIAAMPLKNDHKYVVVDTKIHMLMPGFYPAIPGWHVDHTPRGPLNDPGCKENPKMGAQEILRAPRMHLLVTGFGCLTEFIRERNVYVPIDDGQPKLFAQVNDHVALQLRCGDLHSYRAPSCQVISWDWWEIHQGCAATEHEWRFLIRVTETDYQAPQTDPRKFIRTQNQVYVLSPSFGW